MCTETDLCCSSNIALSKPTILLMDSGVYRVQNAFCDACREPIGWKFVSASEKSEKWKEGYHVLELDLLAEESVPMTPWEEYRDERGFQDHWTRMHRLSGYALNEGTADGGLGLGHRRSASNLSVMGPRPLGPRRS